MYYPSSENEGADQLRCYREADLICVFAFAYADCWFSHGAAHILPNNIKSSCLTQFFLMQPLNVIQSNKLRYQGKKLCIIKTLQCPVLALDDISTETVLKIVFKHYVITVNILLNKLCFCPRFITLNKFLIFNNDIEKIFMNKFH